MTSTATLDSALSLAADALTDAREISYRLSMVGAAAEGQEWLWRSGR